MALGRTRAVALSGLDGRVVDVEADLASGLPAFTVVGLPDTSVGEARDRVRAAAANSGVPVPMRRLTVNLSPASVPKTGTSFDLAVAVAVLAAADSVPVDAVADVVHIGELGLDGTVRGVRGVLPAVLAAKKHGVRRVVVPAANLTEARLVPDVTVVGARSLTGLVAHHRGEAPVVEDLAPGPRPCAAPVGPEIPVPDLSEVLGQADARSALEVAAAGGHHLFLVGPPGAGKTMLASRLPGLLPDLTEAAALEVTGMHSLAGLLPDGAGLLTRPPFVDPHHTASTAAVVGGGAGLPRPGAASRAHHGVLLLDEAPEFSTQVLDALRQPLESGELVIHRARGEARYPARFQLVLAANPCPCGRATGKGLDCTCSPMARRRYLGRLSGPLLDRVDLQVQVYPVTLSALSGELPESSAVVAARVAAARAAQRERLAGTTWSLNSEVPGSRLRRGLWRLPRASTKALDQAMDRGTLSVRGYDRLLRVAWSLADLDGAVVPRAEHVARAMTLRQHQAVAA